MLFFHKFHPGLRRVIRILTAPGHPLKSNLGRRRNGYQGKAVEPAEILDVFGPARSINYDEQRFGAFNIMCNDLGHKILPESPPEHR